MKIRNEWVESIDLMVNILKKIELSEDLHVYTSIRDELIKGELLSRPIFSLRRS